jgi:pyruvate kinase
MVQLREIREMLEHLDREMELLAQAHPVEPVRPRHRDGARNLLHYVALRQHDIRGLQEELAKLGLSSLGRMESRGQASVRAVLRVLTQLDECHLTEPVPGMREGRQQLERNTEALLGPRPAARSVRIMVTMPSEAASNPQLLRDLLVSGMDCMRINCAHDGPEAWAAMIGHLRRAEQETGLGSRVHGLAGAEVADRCD